MLFNYLNLAFRNLSRHRSFAALNVIGLATGVAAVLLIYRIVTFELSFNQQFSQYDRIVRIVTHELGRDGEPGYTRGIPIPAMSEIQRSVSQFAATAKVKECWPTVIVPAPGGAPSQKKFSVAQEKIAFFAEPAFFQIFDFPWLAGDKQQALQQPNTLVITRKTAERCFDSWQNAVGQTLLIDNQPMTVQGVIENPSLSCDFPISMIVSYATLLSNKELYDYQEDWGGTSSNDQQFALLNDPGQFDAAAAQLLKVGQKEYAEEGAGQRQSKSHHLQRLADLHYDDRYGTSATAVISKDRLWVLSSIGFLVLLMACFNFINLSTAQALRRSKEVGVRKTLGGNRSDLFWQFMSETALVVLFSLGLGIIIAWTTAPLLKHISEVPPELPFLSAPAIWGFLLVLGLLMTLFSGFYPALVLAGFNPIRALRNNLSTQGAGGANVRKGLVVFQFVIAQALLVGTLITLGQLNYIREMDLGFSKDLIYNFSINGDSLSQSKLAGFKQRLLQIPGVESVAFGSDQPASGSTWMTNFSIGSGTKDQPFNTTIKFCDADFLKTYNLQLLAGRWLEQCDTTKEYVVNETLLRKAGVPNAEAALNMELRLGGGKYRRIVGVVKDFHAHSAHRTVEPLVMGSRLERMYGAGVKIAPKNISATTAAIQRCFDETYTDQVFDPNFFDESIADFYIAENRFADTCKGFAILAILISCLGLLGLAAHAAQRRTKEIGVRKVLGASVAGITGLLAKDFLKLVLIAIIIASPIAWYFMHKWLEDFVYRIDIQWWMFVVAGLGAIAIAFLTISYQSIKAALVNPVKSLRSE